jgi:hypothetical protein
MSNLISLHKRQVFLDGLPVEFAKMTVTLTGTQTQVNVYSDSGLSVLLSQPIESDANGVFPPCYVDGGGALRLLVTDEDDAPLPGYPMDNIVPEDADPGDASGVTFNPTDDVPETDVQAAIEAVAALFTSQSGTLERYFTAYTTGGTGDNYTLSPSPVITTYAAGQMFLVLPDRANTGAATMNINGVGSRNLMILNAAGTPAALTGGEIQPYREMWVRDDGTQLLISFQRETVAHGSNANGNWLRIGKIQVCWQGAVHNAAVSATTTDSDTWTFPKVFASPPATWCNVRETTDTGGAEDVVADLVRGSITNLSGNPGTEGAAYAVRNADSVSHTIRLDVFALGWSF